MSTRYASAYGELDQHVEWAVTRCLARELPIGVRATLERLRTATERLRREVDGPAARMIGETASEVEEWDEQTKRAVPV